jgi:hypothetical protein
MDTTMTKKDNWTARFFPRLIYMGQKHGSYSLTTEDMNWNTNHWYFHLIYYYSSSFSSPWCLTALGGLYELLQKSGVSEAHWFPLNLLLAIVWGISPTTGRPVESLTASGPSWFLYFWVNYHSQVYSVLRRRVLAFAPLSFSYWCLYHPALPPSHHDDILFYGYLSLHYVKRK